MTATIQRLANGLTVIVDPMPGAQSSSVGLYAAVGSRSEPAARGGLAHMVEHMVFKGAGSRDARNIAEAIEDVGGSLNAWTARDQTVFHARTLPDDVPLAIELISDLIRAPHFDADELEREKSVILSELGEIRDNPEDTVGDLLFEAAFADQALGRPIIGTETSIRSISRDDLSAWMTGELVASRLVMVATGAVEVQQIVSLAEARLGDMPSVAAAPPAHARFTGGERVDRRTSEQAHWSFAFQAPGGAHPTMPATAIFAQVVGGGMSSRLFQQLREERGLCYSVYSWVQGFAETGIFGVSAATDQEDAPAALALARAIVSETVETLTEVEVARARAQVEAQLRMSLETVQGRADHHARAFELFGRLVSLEEAITEVRAVDLAAAKTAGEQLVSSPVAFASIGSGSLALAA
jgi:predicted Zn-dependent peptidase